MFVQVQVVEIQRGIVRPRSPRSFAASGLLFLHLPAIRLIPPCQTQDKKVDPFLPASEDVGIVFRAVWGVLVLVTPFGLNTRPPGRHLVAKIFQDD